jgi:hypothetical protein
MRYADDRLRLASQTHKDTCTDLPDREFGELNVLDASWRIAALVRAAPPSIRHSSVNGVSNASQINTASMHPTQIAIDSLIFMQ